MGSYGSLIGGSAQFAGVDQGIDFTGPGPVFALGNGVVTRLVAHGSGWPGEGALLVYKLTSGRYAGRYIYIAEDFAVGRGLRVGAKIKAGQVLGRATGSGKAPGIEVGWADPAGHAIAHAPSSGPTAWGHDFNSFVTGAQSVGAAVGSAGAAIGAQPAKQVSHVGPQTILPVASPAPAPTIGGYRVPGVAPPPTVPFTPRHYAEVWDQIAGQPNASPETRLYAQNAGVIAGADSATERAA